MLAAAFAVLAFSATPAFAYQESTTTVDPNDTPAWACVDCHGLESGFTSPTVAPTRKGPHGGYTTGTQKCETCHTLHGAQGARMLLPEITIEATCNTCHDGTGGGGVYGVIKQRTGSEPAGTGHRVGTSSQSFRVLVPGGDPAGGAIEYSFTGERGAMTCTDCHDPHDARTVAPFVGDRKRSAGDTLTSLPTDRLLKQRPTSSETTATYYGSDWCQTCHKGSHTTGSSGFYSHSVADTRTAPGWWYDRVQRLEGYETTKVAAQPGPLGGNNFGYVLRPGGAQKAPICQQCHEDARAIANVEPFEIDSVVESFTAPADGVVNGNPRFQNFPHETMNRYLLIENGDSLCLNCHPTRPVQ